MSIKKARRTMIAAASLALAPACDVAAPGSAVEEPSSSAEASASASTSASLLRCPNGDGQYCGGHGVAGDGDALHECVAGAFTFARTCADGCARMGDGGSDFCHAPPAPMPACPKGDGFYCGGHGCGGDDRVLHHCVGGQLAIERVCDEGCVQIGEGAGDACAEDAPPFGPPLAPAGGTAPAPSGNGGAQLPPNQPIPEPEPLPAPAPNPAPVPNGGAPAALAPNGNAPPAPPSVAAAAPSVGAPAPSTLPPNPGAPGSPSPIAPPAPK